MGIALLGYGTPSFRSTPARFTQRVGSIANGASSNDLPIPKFAQSFGVIGEQGTIAGSKATMFPEVVHDAFGHQAVAILTDGQMESAYYIPNGYRALQIANGSGITQAFNVVYSLML
jgi:hypothetical protein